MNIAVLSGKGGTGKTFVAVNLAAAAALQGGAVYADCDVEEPNGDLFFPMDGVRRQDVCRPVPVFDASRCDACRACVSFCRFHALTCVGRTPRVFAEMCHCCGGCALVCPRGAVAMQPRRVGTLQQTAAGRVSVIGGRMEPGEASNSGYSDMQRLVQTMRMFDVPLAVCVNRWDVNAGWTQQIEAFCARERIAFVGRVPYDEAVIAAVNDARNPAPGDSPAALALRQVYERTMQLLKV